jgi:NADH dehydrogenase [ubiquinone] 1 alpha subcomplex assembly factor 6
LKWKQVPTKDMLEDYAHNLYSNLFYIMLHANNLSTVHTDHVASHLGKAFGLCQLLRGTPYHAQNNETYLPAELCAKFGVEEFDIYSGKNSVAMENVVFEIADLAKGHLDSARSFAEDKNTPIPKEAYPIFYPAIACDIFLKELEKANFNIFDPSLEPQKLRLKFSWQLMKAGWLGKY